MSTGFEFFSYEKRFVYIYSKNRLLRSPESADPLEKEVPRDQWVHRESRVFLVLRDSKDRQATEDNQACQENQDYR